VARDYIDLRGFQHDLAITENNLKSQQETLDLTRKRFNAGISSDLDVAQAEAEVETTQASIPSLETTVRQDIYAISTLCGQTPEELSGELSPEKPMPNKWPMVPLGMPSDIVRHRPDVRRAERQLAAANANVGVATADLFPKFSLTGSYGWDATKLGGLFSDPANTWAVGPNVTWPIFSAGQIQANIRVQNALQAQAVATYSEAVLTALQDVENSLVAYHREQDRRIALAQAVASDQRAFDLSTQLYQRGLVDFLSVLDSERALYTAQDLRVRSDIAVSEDLIALYKALGGGWE
jgi:NodT family efflux transporter outer membrane factor (OMF) lipoprotein